MNECTGQPKMPFSAPHAVASILCIASAKGDVLAFSQFRDDVSNELFEGLLQTVTENKPGTLPPVIKQEGVSCFYIIRENVLFLVATKTNLGTFAAVEFLERFYHLVKDFCGAATEDAIQLNTCLIQELMNEILDFGYIQLTRTEHLRPFVFSDPVTLKTVPETYDPTKPGLFGLEKPVIPPSAANKPAVRPRAVQDYRQSEIFLSVIERITAHMKADGAVYWFQLNGSIQVRSFVPGNLPIRLGFNEDLLVVGQEGSANPGGYTTGVRLNQCSFHECVRSSGFQANNTLFIQPPQGDVTIMTYQMASLLPPRLPFHLVSAVKESQATSDLDVILKLHCNVPLNSEAVNVVVHIPVPGQTTSFMQQFSIPDHTAEFIPSERKIKWHIRKFVAGSEALAKFRLIEANINPSSKLELGPISIEFELSNFVCSNVMVRSIHVEHGAESLMPQIKKWVRYATVSDSYVFKL